MVLVQPVVVRRNSNSIIMIPSAHAMLLYGFAAIGLAYVLWLPVQITRGVVSSTTTTTTTITACTTTTTTTTMPMYDTTAATTATKAEKRITKQQHNDESMLDININITAVHTIIGANENTRTTKETSMTDEEEEQQQHQQREEPPPISVDLLAGLPPLSTQNFTAEVTFQRDMKLAGVPNLADFQACHQVNVVPSRGGKIVSTFPEPYRNDSHRPYSLRARDFQWQRHQRNCSTVRELGDAIKYGTRVWDDNIRNIMTTSSWTWQDEEMNPSSFEYHQCDIPILSPADQCRILNQFSHVIFLGDSLSRHAYDGLHISLRNDFVSGRMLTSDETILKRCRCDGQYSEDLLCRAKKSEYSSWHGKPFSSGYGVCPSTENNNENGDDDGVHVQYMDASFVFNCFLNSTKPILLLLNGGSHYDLSVFKTYQDQILNYLSHPRLQACAREEKLVTIWQSYIAHSVAHEQGFPTQTQDKAVKFNEKMKKLLASELEVANIAVVDHFNFTKGAQTADGLHALTNVNYFKAQHYLHVANLMLQEQMFTKHIEYS
jgi:hypothetical protein